MGLACTPLFSAHFARGDGEGAHTPEAGRVVFSA
jgi:hypothetical protein